MSEENKVAKMTPRKGFRQPKKPTKGDVQKENIKLSQQLAMQVQFMMQQLQNTAQKTMQNDREIDELAKLLCSDAIAEGDTLVEGDKVMIGYKGQIVGEDGELEPPRQEMYAPYTLLDLGQKKFVPGFEEQVIGLTVGTVGEIKVKFPDEYHETLKGKEAVFKIQVFAGWRPTANVIEAEYMEFLKAEQEKKQAELDAKKEAADAEAKAAAAEDEAIKEEIAEQAKEESTSEE